MDTNTYSDLLKALPAAKELLLEAQVELAQAEMDLARAQAAERAGIRGAARARERAERWVRELRAASRGLTS